MLYAPEGTKVIFYWPLSAIYKIAADDKLSSLFFLQMKLGFLRLHESSPYEETIHVNAKENM